MNEMKERKKERKNNAMEQQLKYFHLYANGNEAANFIICENDFRYEINLIGICAHHSGVGILAFSIEDTHPHFILYGTDRQAKEFMKLFSTKTLHHIRFSRGTSDGTVLDFRLDIIDSQDYLMNACSYVITQCTKDGKQVMPYDYRWGTGSMYFRPIGKIPIWCIDDGNWRICTPFSFGSIPYREKRRIFGTIPDIPEEWMICNGIILPDNYVDVGRYESIFKTHNCFRTFMSAGRTKEQFMLDKMAQNRGVQVDDQEARKLCKKTCIQLFNVETARWLDVNQRLELAKTLRKGYHLSFRQLATLSRLPESEITKFIR